MRIEANVVDRGNQVDAGQPKSGLLADNDIWVQPLDGGAARQLTHLPADGQQIWGAAWSADGKRLAVGRASIKNNIVLFRGLKRPGALVAAAAQAPAPWVVLRFAA